MKARIHDSESFHRSWTDKNYPKPLRQAKGQTLRLVIDKLSLV